MATHRNYIECEICETMIMTRTTFTYERLEFAFPCPECSSEIIISFDVGEPDEESKNLLGNLAPPQVREGNTFNARWFNPANEEATIQLEQRIKHTKMFDVDHLISKYEDYSSGISPFLEHTFLVGFENLEQYGVDASARNVASKNLWSKIEQMILHAQRKQWTFFDRAYKNLGYENELQNNTNRMEGLYEALEKYGSIFRPIDIKPYEEIKGRISLAEKVPSEVSTLVNYYVAKHKDVDLENQIQNLRKQWTKIYAIIAPIYVTQYWDKTRYNLVDYTISQKRFEDLKNFYIDCFETFCRISVIAATIEGIIKKGKAVVPKAKGKEMSIEQFDIQNNGTKPDILKNLHRFVADLFVPFIDHKLRNGIGHNAAKYNVWNDEIEYATENDKGLRRFNMPYILFCEKVLNLYGQLELVSLYLNWLGLKSYEMRNP